ncbi:MAG: hypothetical protein ACREFE_10385 [Limisphaerales bacterium]
MKLNFSKYNFVEDDVSSLTSSGLPNKVRDSLPRLLRLRQRGIALVITLILLAVTLVMAVAFLAISRRERGSVTTTTDTATARLAADSALANAEAQIIANVFSTTNPYNFGLIVSTNYINYAGYDSSVSGYDPTNVNYDYLAANGSALNQNEFLQNVANLFYSPRPPVFIVTNSQTGASDFRYYLDLNRDGRFEASGVVPNVELNAGGQAFTNGTTFEIGDPQWIGVLAQPDAPHSADNQFVSRYAFIAMPIGNTLDLNYIHNQTHDTVGNRRLNPASDEFFRNQGVGSWEINLAAFLADLNTNEWLPTIPPNNGYYSYNEPINYNTGRAFDDARALLAYRYGNQYSSLAAANNYFANLVNYPSNVDLYSDGPLQTNEDADESIFSDTRNLPWAGAANPTNYFSMQDLFDPDKTEMNILSPGFVEHLQQATANSPSTYDRYTFYRLLSQLGTDSSPETDKINLNYSNAVVSYDGNGIPTSITIIPNAETNLVPWLPINFFTAAANQMLLTYTANWFKENPTNYLETYYGIIPQGYLDASGIGVTNVQYFGQTNQIPAFGITNIPVYVNGQFVYSSAVNRILQLAANIYDATTRTNFGMDYPSVFRPTFWVTNQSGYKNVYINGYEMPSVQPPFNVLHLPPPLDQPVDVTSLNFGVIAGNLPGRNVYGVPWIIGAKKGFPNFNEFSMNTVVQMTRKLEIGRQSTNTPPVFTRTNQMYVFRINNSLGVECWNSYTNPYLNQVQIFVQDTNTVAIMVSNVITSATANIYSTSYSGPISTNVSIWPGSTWVFPFVGSGLDPDVPSPFIIPLNINVLALTNSVYRFGEPFLGYTVPGFIPVAANSGWENIAPPLSPLPQMFLLMTNRLQVVMLDGRHIIDYVQFSGPDRDLNLTSIIQTNGTGASYANMFSTALGGNNIPWGVISQFQVSEGDDYNNSQDWDDSKKNDEILGFSQFMGVKPFGVAANFTISDPNVYNSYATNLLVQVPFTPTITIGDYTSWQANDPLVHYLASDLNFSGTETSGLTTGIQKSELNGTNMTAVLPDLGTVNERYKPWYLGDNADQITGNQIAYKDPLM